MRIHRSVLSTTGLVVVLLLCVGCGKRVASSTPAPSATVVPSATATALPATSTSAPSPTPALPVQEPVVLGSIQMMTSTDGWAIERGAEGRILRTTDGALTWEDVSVPGIGRSSADGAYFMDLSDAWVTASSFVTSSSGSITTTVTVYRTTDSARTWQGGTPFDVPGAGVGGLKFLDRQHGWVLASLGVAAGSEAVAIYRTTDGGDRWERVSLTAGIPGESTPDSLPFGCDKSGLTFVNSRTGWATGFCPGGQIFFYVSHDGGKTWKADTLPAPPGYPATLYSQCQCAVNPPLFFSGQDGFMALGIYEAALSWQLYVTDDAGMTWSPHPLPVTQPIGQVDMIDDRNGWVTDGTTLYRTENGGQTWGAVGPFPTSDMVGSLNFVSIADGWFLVDQGLYVTHDGGQSWAPIAPTLSSGTSAADEGPVADVQRAGFLRTTELVWPAVVP